MQQGAALEARGARTWRDRAGRNERGSEPNRLRVGSLFAPVVYVKRTISDRGEQGTIGMLRHVAIWRCGASTRSALEPMPISHPRCSCIALRRSWVRALSIRTSTSVE